MRYIYPLVCFCVLGCGPEKADEAAQLRLQHISVSFVVADQWVVSTHVENKKWFERARAAGYDEELKEIEAAYVELHAAAAIVATIKSRLPPTTDGKTKRMSASAVKAIEAEIKDYEEKRNKYHKLSNTTLAKIAQTNEKKPPERE